MRPEDLVADSRPAVAKFGIDMALGLVTSGSLSVERRRLVLRAAGRHPESAVRRRAAFQAARESGLLAGRDLRGYFELVEGLQSEAPWTGSNPMRLWEVGAPENLGGLDMEGLVDLLTDEREFVRGMAWASLTTTVAELALKALPRGASWVAGVRARWSNPADPVAANAPRR